MSRHGLDALCRLLYRSVRRTIPGHARHVRQPAVPQRRGHGARAADPVAADTIGGARRGHLRQGPAGDADGRGGGGRPAGRHRAGGRDAARRPTARTPARCRPSARASRTASSRSRRPLPSAAARARRPAVAASSSAPRRRRRWWQKPSASPCRTARSRRQVSRSGSMVPPARCTGCRRSARSAGRHGRWSPMRRFATRW